MERKRCKTSLLLLFTAVLFLQFWKRHVARLAFEWDCLDFHDIDEKPRPDYMNLASERTRNPITGDEEPHFPQEKRLRRKCASLSFILFMVNYRKIIQTSCIFGFVILGVSWILIQLLKALEMLLSFTLAAKRRKYSGDIPISYTVLSYRYIYQSTAEFICSLLQQECPQFTVELSLSIQ